MTWTGVGPSGQIGTFNQGGGTGSFGYEPPQGDVTGPLDDLVVIGLRGRNISSATPISGDVYQWDGSNWEPTDVSAIVSVSGNHNLLSLIHPDTVPFSPPVEGDLIAGNSSSRWARFPLGLEGQKLRTTSFGLAWAYDDVSVIASGATVNLLSSSHKVILNKIVGSPTIVNLPSSPHLGKEVIIKDGRGDGLTNTISIVPQSGATIDGLSSVYTSRNYQSYTLLWNGNDWNVI